MQHQAPAESARRLLSLPPRADRFASYFVLFGFTLFLCVRLYRLIDRYAVNIFYYDQWMQSWAMLRHSGRERFASPFELAGILPGVPEISGFFAQMGTWYLGVGAIFTEVVYGLSRWNARTEGFAIYGLVVIAMLIAFRLKASLFGPLSLSDASIPVIFMTATQFESFWGTPFASHAALPVLLALVYCGCWLLEGHIRKYAAIVGINFLVTFTGNGFLLGALTPPLLLFDAYLARRDGRRKASIAALVGAALSIVTLLCWYLQQVHFVAFPCFKFPHDPAIDYVRFVGHMFGTFLGFRGQSAVLASGAGLVVMSLVVGVCIHQIRVLLRESHSGRARHWVILVLGGYCLAFCFACAVGRVCAGMAAAEVSRYMTLLIPGFFAIYLGALTIPSAYPRNTVLLMFFGLVMIGTYPIRAADRASMELSSKLKADWRDCYLRLENVERCNALTQHAVWPYADFYVDFNWQLRQLKARRLGLFADVEPDAILK